MQIISNDRTVGSETVQDLNVFNTQFLATEVERGEHLVSMMPAVEKAFDLMGDDKIKLSIGNESLKRSKMGSYD